MLFLLINILFEFYQKKSFLFFINKIVKNTNISFKFPLVLSRIYTVCVLSLKDSVTIENPLFVGETPKKRPDSILGRKKSSFLESVKKCMAFP